MNKIKSLPLCILGRGDVTVPKGCDTMGKDLTSSDNLFQKKICSPKIHGIQLNPLRSAEAWIPLSTYYALLKSILLRTQPTFLLIMLVVYIVWWVHSHNEYA